MKNKAFTLAEILISMVIIGVVSMLMVPVMQNVQEKSLEVGTAHFHSMMSQAIKHYMVDQNADSLSSTKMAAKEEEEEQVRAAYKGLDDFMYKYLNVTKVCSYNDRFDCFNREVKNLNNRKGEFVLNYWYDLGPSLSKVYVLENGNVIYMCPSNNFYPATIQVDINGKKGPNKVGRDIWMMSVYADGVLSEHLHRFMMKEDLRSNPTELKQKVNEELNNAKERCTQDAWQYGAGCFARFEHNGFKFDY